MLKQKVPLGQYLTAPAVGPEGDRQGRVDEASAVQLVPLVSSPAARGCAGRLHRLHDIDR